MTTALDTDTLVPALLSAADQHASGELSTSLPDAGPAQVFLKEGQVYGVVVPDGGRSLGEMLVAKGALSGPDLEYALEAQRRDVPGWRIGELLVHLGFVTADQVQACLAEQMREMLGWLLTQPATPWHMRRGSRTRYSLAPPIDVPWLLAALGVADGAEDTVAYALEPLPEPAPVEAAIATVSEPPFEEAQPGAVAAEASTEHAEPAESAESAEEGMVRSDALATLSGLYTDEEDEEEAPRPQMRSVFGFLRPVAGTRQRGSRRTG